MFGKSKWIEIHSPDEPVERVAARTLEGRLLLVADYLPKAAGVEAGDDNEHVHQARVATRRALTTLSMFEHLLPVRRAKWFRKQLKRVRRAASEARDYDVLADRLAERNVDRNGDTACEDLVVWIKERRRKAQKPIRKISARLEKKRFQRRAKRLVKKLLKRPSGENNGAETFGVLARARMRELTDEFFGYSHEELSDIEKLHQFRVCGKHLRYAMEIFAGAFCREFREEIYPQIEALQEQLGTLNDHAVATGYYEQWLADTDDEGRRALLRELIDEEAAEISRRHDQFLHDWTSQRATDLRQRFFIELSPVETQVVAVG
jgi:CHAD domain-containing protein